MKNHLIMYYGEGCPDCIKMEPLLGKLLFETGISLLQKEVWNDSKNEAEMLRHDKDDACGGVPFFLNTKTKKTLCGEVSYKELKKWAEDK